jgi:hypothetical protein
MRRPGRHGFVTFGCAKLAFLSVIDGLTDGRVLLGRAELKPRFPSASPDLFDAGTGSSRAHTQFDRAPFAGPRRGACTGRGALQPTSHPLAALAVALRVHLEALLQALLEGKICTREEVRDFVRELEREALQYDEE